MDRRTSIEWTIKGFCLVSLLPAVIIGQSGCKENIESDKTKLKVLNAAQLTTLSIIADVMIPKSENSPAASEVGVGPTIDSVLHHFYNDNNQQQILQGLTKIEDLSAQLFQKPVDKCTLTEQNKIVQYLADSGLKSKKPKDHLFFILRDLVIHAYFQSKHVSEKVLRYDPIPGTYNGCFLTNDGERNWSL